MIGHSGKVICFALLNKYYVLTKQFPRYLCLLLWVVTAVSVSLESFLFDFLSSLVFCNSENSTEMYQQPCSGNRNKQRDVNACFSSRVFKNSDFFLSQDMETLIKRGQKECKSRRKGWSVV